jgi:hypothetical protein
MAEIRHRAIVRRRIQVHRVRAERRDEGFEPGRLSGLTRRIDEQPRPRLEQVRSGGTEAAALGSGNGMTADEGPARAAAFTISRFVEPTSVTMAVSCARAAASTSSMMAGTGTASTTRSASARSPTDSRRSSMIPRDTASSAAIDADDPHARQGSPRPHGNRSADQAEADDAD